MRSSARGAPPDISQIYPTISLHPSCQKEEAVRDNDSPSQDPLDTPSEEQPEGGFTLVELCQHVWTLATPDEEGFLDGGQMRPLMLMSELPLEVLGELWALVDEEEAGKVSREDLSGVK